MKALLLRTAYFLPGLCLLVLLHAGSARAAPEFPDLAGRVVDSAGLLAASAAQQLAGQLEQHEQETSNQVVVVTLPSLQGYAIDDYGYQLGRHWGIGQAGRDNGVLLIVAAEDRKVRIEVGYGLEGTLTDARSHEIIHNVILPQFRNNQYEDGIVRGTQAILDTLQGTYEPLERKAAYNPGVFFSLVIFLVSVGEFIAAGIGSRAVSAGILGGLAVGIGWLLLGSLKIGLLIGFFVAIFHFFSSGSGGPGSRRGSRYYQGGSSGGFGGGFGGGGGSFGGGGASGGW